MYVYNDIKGDRQKLGEKGTSMMDSVKVEIMYLNNYQINDSSLLADAYHYEMSSKYKRKKIDTKGD